MAGLLVTPTARLSILNALLLERPDTLDSTPAWLLTGSMVISHVSYRLPPIIYSNIAPLSAEETSLAYLCKVAFFNPGLRSFPHALILSSISCRERFASSFHGNVYCYYIPVPDCSYRSLLLQLQANMALSEEHREAPENLPSVINATSLSQAPSLQSQT